MTLQDRRIAELQKGRLEGKSEGRPFAFPFCNPDFLQSCN